MILKPPLFAKPIHGHPLGPDGGLVGCWPMNEGAYNKDFNKVFDLSGNGNTGTIQGDMSWSSGKFGSCLIGDGSDGFIEEDKKIISGYPFTVINWFMCTSGQGGVNFSIVESGEATIRYLIYLSISTYKLNLFASNTTAYVASSAATYDDGLWHQVVGVFKSDTEKILYVDGKYEATLTDSVTFNSAVDRWSIGHSGDSTPSGDFLGKLGNTSLYNRALSASEIALLYSKPFCMFERDPIELWSAATLGAAPPVGNAGIMTTNTGYWGPIY